MNGKRDGFTLSDFRARANTALMKRGRAEAIVEKFALPSQNGLITRNKRR